MVNTAPEYDILIATRTAPTYTGGLANYQLTLATALLHAMPGCRIGFLVFEAAQLGQLPVRDLPPHTYVLSEHFREPRGLWMRLASRPWLHGILEYLIRRTFRPGKLADQMIPRAKVIHYVGTGWDFFGFAMCQWARHTGARFTIWPALHPGTWGDDRIDLRLYQLADIVFCQSNYEIEHLASLGLPRNRTIYSILPPMCRTTGDGNRFRERFDLGGRKLVLFVGRRDAEKGYFTICEIWPHIVSHHPDAVLVLAGPGAPQTERLTNAICDLGIPDDETLADAFAAADVFCLPSANESFGLVYAEAWSYGKPVICGTAPASRELVQESGGGIVSDQSNGALAEALLSLLADENLRVQLGRSGHKFQQNMLNQEKFVEIHRKAFAI